jgi:hypothetical protein
LNDDARNANYPVDITMTRGLSTTLPTQLPAQYERLFAWNLDRRCKAVRDVAADLYELWQDLGGVENLSAQKRWLCERVVYLRRRCVAYETVVMHNADLEPGKEALPLPMDHGAYSNHANVLQGYLKTLGLNRQSRPTETLRDIMRGEPDAPAPVSEQGSAP